MYSNIQFLYNSNNLLSKMTTLTLVKTKTIGSTKTYVKIDATKSVVSIDARINSQNINLVSALADSTLKRTLGEKVQYRCFESSADRLIIEVLFTSAKELTFVQLCAIEDIVSCLLDKLQSIEDSVKSINHIAEDLYGTISNYYGKDKKPTTPEKKTGEK